MAIDRRMILSVNWPLLGITLLIFGLGLVNLYSASGYRLEGGLTLGSYYQKQLVWGAGGLLLMLACTLFDYRQLNLGAWPFYVLTVMLLLAVPILGKTVYGAKRWLAIGPISLQPSELAKIAILILGAKILATEGGLLNWRQLLLLGLMGMVPVALVIRQPDLGSGLNILLLLGGLIVYRGLRAQIVRVLVVAVPLLAWLSWDFLKPYQRQRIITFMDPGADPLGSGYHIIQSQIAVGSGGLWGKGFLAGTQSQLRFLPEKHTDFAFAVYGEEWGFVGCMLLLLLFCLFLHSIHVTARDAKDRFGSFLAAGVFFYFFWQILINTGMVLGIMPVVGIPLPFISYGGSAMLVNMSLIGLVLNVSMRRYLFKQA